MQSRACVQTDPKFARHLAQQISCVQISGVAAFISGARPLVTSEIISINKRRGPACSIVLQGEQPHFVWSPFQLLSACLFYVALALGRISWLWKSTMNSFEMSL